MRVLEASPAARFCVRLDSGDELPRRIEDEARARGWASAFFTGTGTLSQLDLAVGGGRAPLELRDADVVALTGELALHAGRPVATLRVVVAVRGELRAGTLAHGVARDLVLLVDVLDGAAAVATTTAAEPTAAPVFPAPERREVRPRQPAPEPDDSPPTGKRPAAGNDGPSWADVAAASAAEQERAVLEETYRRMADRPAPARPVSAARPVSPMKPIKPRPAPAAPSGPPPVLPEALRPVVPTKVRRSEDDLFDDPIPEPGDWLDHPQFGRCLVEGDDDGGGTYVRIPSGSRKSINLDMLQVLPGVVDEEGRRVFKIEGPRRRR